MCGSLQVGGLAASNAGTPALGAALLVLGVEVTAARAQIQESYKDVERSE